MEQLIVRLGSRADDPIHWLVWSDNEGEIIASGELPDASQLSTLSERAGDRSVIALAPGSDILLKWVDLPPRAGRKVLSAIPYMLEDELATDIESQFFAYGEKVGNQQAVAVVSHAQMSTWKQWLDDAGLYCDTLLPDVLSVPHNPDGWTLLTLGEQLILREDSWRGMQGESTWLLPTLAHYADHLEQPITLVSYTDVTLPEMPGVTVTAPPAELPMQVLAKEALACRFNLFQGSYKIKRNTRSAWHRWRLAAALAVVAIGASLVDKGLTLYQLQQQNEALRAQIEETVDAGFPNIGPYRDVKRKLQSELARLEQSGGSASMLVMLEQLSGPFSASQVRPQTLRFDASRTEIRVQAVGSSFEALESFRRQAENAGFVVEQGAINNRDDEVIGTVSIRSTS
ncbi:type II secretion system protein GspL [Alteromonas halophila]|uniref:Type II secretion system protein L n=1 Tax=Alteromonas halophila TaxID=516698 RepID=A0A918JP71_9ALTE|nr:type II secretion system protein GspL [Alteromonas halophila]GGW90769.1 type II secretion system protein L [Alteromonas halophila]